MEWLGVELDRDRNRAGAELVSSDRSRVRVMVLPTNEELMIARHTADALAGRSQPQAAAS
jgi:acetate kinase